MNALLAIAAVPYNISNTFTVHTVEYDESGSIIAKQKISRDAQLKRQYMTADGELAHGHLEEAMRCDLFPLGYVCAPPL